jgi:hypothetical protein
MILPVSCTSGHHCLKLLGEGRISTKINAEIAFTHLIYLLYISRQIVSDENHENHEKTVYGIKKTKKNTSDTSLGPARSRKTLNG